MKGALFQLECLVMKSSFTVNGFIDTDVKFIRNKVDNYNVHYSANQSKANNHNVQYPTNQNKADNHSVDYQPIKAHS
jgi:hypothetical protein